MASTGISDGEKREAFCLAKQRVTGEGLNLHKTLSARLLCILYRSFRQEHYTRAVFSHRALSDVGMPVGISELSVWRDQAFILTPSGLMVNQKGAKFCHVEMAQCKVWAFIVDFFMQGKHGRFSNQVNIDNDTTMAI